MTNLPPLDEGMEESAPGHRAVVARAGPRWRGGGGVRGAGRRGSEGGPGPAGARVRRAGAVRVGGRELDGDIQH
jgi:hypothetical protein